MTLLDAYALVAFLIGGPATSQVRAILREGDAAVTSANLAEALDVSERLYGLPVARSFSVLEPLFEQTLTALPLDVPTARRAAEIRARHYHRTTCPISLADAVCLGSALGQGRIATADPAILGVARAEKIDAVALPAQR